MRKKESNETSDMKLLPKRHMSRCSSLKKYSNMYKITGIEIDILKKKRSYIISYIGCLITGTDIIEQKTPNALSIKLKIEKKPLGGKNLQMRKVWHCWPLLQKTENRYYLNFLAVFFILFSEKLE